MLWLKKLYQRRAATIPQTTDDTGPRQKALDSQDETRKSPMRQCAVTRESRSQHALIRFARSPDGIVVPDLAGKLPGRGVWITGDRETLEKGLKSGVFSRAFKARSEPVDGLIELVEQQLLQRCVGLLGLARKGGHAVIGYDQVRAALRKSKPDWLIEATDGGEDGRNKVHALAKALYKQVNTAGALTSAELGMAFGRGSVVHALIEHAPVSQSFALAYRRLTGFRAAPELEWFTGKTPGH